MANESPTDLVKAYLQDAIAAEKNFETQLRTMAKEGNDEIVHALFAQHADETRVQYERLTARLNDLGGSTSGLKTFLAHMLGLAPKMAQVGHDEAERVTQNLMMAFAVEHSEVAMYEALSTVAEAAGDTATAALAREIQQQERETAEKVWYEIPRVARQAFRRVVYSEAGGGASNVRRAG
jgi:ferritin-like metal-binding protein YciE